MAESTHICAHCGAESTAGIFPGINVGSSPELKEEVLSGHLFLWTCPVCGKTDLLVYSLVYHDPEGKLIIWQTEDTAASERMRSVFGSSEELSGYTARLVSGPGELIEKIKIFDAGLDDVAMELCKHVTRMETGKVQDLKFLKTEGAESDMILTCPENGQMQMLRIGFNVYEDCCGIISRNADIRKAAEGLCRVDKDMISKFFR